VRQLLTYFFSFYLLFPHSLQLTRATNNQTPLEVFAEVGLPPKKAFVYEADMLDIQVFVEAYCAQLESSVGTFSEGHAAALQKVLQHTPAFSFPSLRSPAQSQTQEGDIDIFCTLLGSLDACPLQHESYARAASSLIEVAATALLAESRGISVSQLLLGDLSANPSNHCSFYTAALNDDVQEMVSSAAFGAQHTPHLKVKLDGNAGRCATILDTLATWSSTSSSSSSSSSSTNTDSGDARDWWSIDANCAWSPALVLSLSSELLPKYRERIKMIEQPFPVSLVFQAAEQEQMKGKGSEGEDLQQWVHAKDSLNRLGIDVYADESMRTYLDIAALAPYVNGVNIKMEKVGGYRAALKAVACAQEAGLKVWFGCMVGSNLNSTQAAALAPLADGGSDLDGSLLVTEDSKLFTGGFQFGPNGTIVLEPLAGLGVQLKAHVSI